VGRKRWNPIQDIEGRPPRCIDDIRTRAVSQQVFDKGRILGSSGDMERSHAFVGLCEIGVSPPIGDAPGILIGAVHLGIHVSTMLHHQIQKLSINGSAASSTAWAAASACICIKNPGSKAGSIQPW
jgi:hypothetical protein